MMNHLKTLPINGTEQRLPSIEEVRANWNPYSADGFDGGDRFCRDPPPPPPEAPSAPERNWDNPSCKACHCASAVVDMAA